MELTRRAFLGAMAASVVTFSLAPSTAWGRSKKYIQPLLIRRTALPVGPIHEAIAEGSSWYASQFDRLSMGPLRLNVLPLAYSYAVVVPGSLESVRQRLRAIIVGMGMPDAPDWLYPILVQGLGAWSITFLENDHAAMSVCSDATIEAICRLPRPYTMDKVHPDWPEYTKTRDGQVGAWWHEVQHGLMQGRDRYLWGASGGGYGHSPYGARLLSGEWYLWPNVGLDLQEARIIVQNGWAG